MKFVTKTPKLEHLDLLEGIYNDKVCEMLKMVASCFNSSLKIFSISNFAGTPAEMELLGFILRKATILQSMIINCRHRYIPKYKEWLEVVANRLYARSLKFRRAVLLSFATMLLILALCFYVNTWELITNSTFWVFNFISIQDWLVLETPASYCLIKFFTC